MRLPLALLHTRRAAKGIVDARTHAQLGAAGEDLATAAQTIGLDRWPRFIGDAERRGVAAVSDGAIPGVVKASATGTDMAVGAIGFGLLLLTLSLKNQNSGLARPTVTPATDPSSSRKPGRRGRIVANGSRDRVDIEVIIEGDKKTVVTGYPTNRPRNPK